MWPPFSESQPACSADVCLHADLRLERGLLRKLSIRFRAARASKRSWRFQDLAGSHRWHLPERIALSDVASSGLADSELGILQSDNTQYYPARLT